MAKQVTRELVEFVRNLEYGRPSDRSIAGMLRERRGTCSTKHLFLAEILSRRIPETRPQIVHRVYSLDRAQASELFGERVAEAIPPGGLVDVHRYLTAEIEGRRVVIDATFPGPPWDGKESLPLACGPGKDFPAGLDPDSEKKRLEVEHCDPTLREPFIEALGRMRKRNQ
jgi:hypothetical protein